MCYGIVSAWGLRLKYPVEWPRGFHKKPIMISRPVRP